MHNDTAHINQMATNDSISTSMVFFMRSCLTKSIDSNGRHGLKTGVLNGSNLQKNHQVLGGFLRPYIELSSRSVKDTFMFLCLCSCDHVAVTKK